MSDIEKIRKINEMSATLKKHGFAMSSDDAASKAQDVYKEKIADAAKAENKAESSPGIAKLERNFEVFRSAAQKEMNTLREDLSSVVGKLNEMIKVINELEKLKDDVTTIDEGKEKQKRLAPKIVKKPKEQKNQRTGDLKPGDINLNETFYYGNK